MAKNLHFSVQNEKLVNYLILIILITFSVTEMKKYEFLRKYSPSQLLRTLKNLQIRPFLGDFIGFSATETSQNLKIFYIFSFHLLRKWLKWKKLSNSPIYHFALIKWVKILIRFCYWFTFTSYANCCPGQKFAYERTSLGVKRAWTKGALFILKSEVR